MTTEFKNSQDIAESILNKNMKNLEADLKNAGFGNVACHVMAEQNYDDETQALFGSNKGIYGLAHSLRVTMESILMGIHDDSPMSQEDKVRHIIPLTGSTSIKRLRALLDVLEYAREHSADQLADIMAGDIAESMLAKAMSGDKEAQMELFKHLNETKH